MKGNKSNIFSGGLQPCRLTNIQSCCVWEQTKENGELFAIYGNCGAEIHLHGKVPFSFVDDLTMATNPKEVLTDEQIAKLREIGTPIYYLHGDEVKRYE